MQYRNLGRSGLKISAIGLGGWLTFDRPDSQREGQAVIDQAMDLGVNFLDTANAYAQGGCERLWGEILKPRSRSSMVLATKVFFPMGEGPNDKGLSRKHIMEQCHASLRRLQTDYIDLYQCHRHDETVPLEETIRAMDDLVRQGKILYWGFSCWPAEAIRETFDICAAGHHAPISSQPKYNLLHRDIEGEIMPLCQDKGVGQVVFCPLEQGLLTGKYRPGEALPAGSRGGDDDQNQFMKHLVSDQAVLEHVERLREVAEEVGCSMAQLALAWLLARPEVSSCITGATRPEQVIENCGAVDVELEPEQVARIGEIIAPVVYSYD